MRRVAFAAAIGLAAALAGCRGRAASAGPPEDEVWLDAAAQAAVRVERAEVRDLPQAVGAPGRVTFDDLHVTHVTSPVTGRVSRVLAQPGQAVRRGTPLVSILSPDVGQAFADVVKAQADLLQAEAEFDRQRRLAAVQAASQRDLEAAEDGYRRAQAESDRAAAKARLLRAGALDAVTQEYGLQSPLEGEVVSRTVNPGMEVQGQYSGGQAQELFVVGDVKRVWVLADVADADLPRVKVGADASVRVAAWPGREFRGKVELISEVLDPAFRTARIRIALANDDEALKPEMYAQVAIAAPPRRALAVPRAALVPLGGETFVYVADGTAPDGRRIFRRRLVRVEDDGGAWVEVKQGLAAGDAAVIEGPVSREPPADQAWITPEQVERAGIRSEAVEARDVPDALAVGGRLAFDDLRVTHVFSPVSGRVTRVLAGPGQRVARGAPLAAILSPDVGAAISDVVKAEADLAQAEHEYRRRQELFEAHAGARRDLEAAEDLYRRARAELDRAREKTRLLRAGSFDRVTQEFVLTSPIDGEVVSRSVSPGQEVQGQYSGASSAPELFTVGDTDRLWVLADVYEMDLPLVREGQPVSVAVAAYPGRRFQGTIQWVADVLDPQLRAARVRCDLDNRGHLLKPEMYEAVTIEVPGKKVVAVPRRALVRDGPDTVVFVDRGTSADGRRVFQRRKVSADEGRAEGLVPVAAGLSPGEKVVTDGALFVLGAL
ncbi:MAG TPA: efflux RND transporter periplasmic adaptor subunit [Anaeromyxobacteraceae bacterium]|nr:efflux RND transporter periplasmic adaptor subunit [Anaeromyxobacteraceae bacterium]